MSPSVRSAAVGPCEPNTCASVCPRTSASVLVDLEAEPNTVTALLTDALPEAILLDHGHPDRVGALARMRGRLGVSTLAEHQMNTIGR